MAKLHDKIARIEMRAVHLGSMPKTSAEAALVRVELLQMLQELRHYKEQRQALEDSLVREAA